MASRALGAFFALAAAALFVVSLATSAWWAGHPIVNGKPWTAKDVNVGLLGATGCNTGGDGSCEAIEVGETIRLATYGELGAVGLATILALALAISAWSAGDRRRGVASASAVFTLLAAGGCGVVMLLGPDIKAAQTVEVPIGWGLYLMGGAVASSWIASLIARSIEQEPLRLKPSLASMQAPPVDVRQVLQGEGLRPAQRRGTPPSVDAVPVRDSAPMFEGAPQLRPLYDPMNAGVLPPPAQPVLPVNIPTPIPRAQISALTGLPTPPPVIEPQPPAKPVAPPMPPLDVPSLSPPRGKPPSIAPPTRAKPPSLAPRVEPPSFSTTLRGGAPGAGPAPRDEPVSFSTPLRGKPSSVAPPVRDQPPTSPPRDKVGRAKAPGRARLDSEPIAPPPPPSPPARPSNPALSPARPPASPPARPSNPALSPPARPSNPALSPPARPSNPALGRPSNPALGSQPKKVPMPARTGNTIPPPNRTLSHAVPPMPTPDNAPPPVVLPAPGTPRAATDGDNTLESAMRATDNITAVEIDAEAKAAFEAQRISGARTSMLESQLGEMTDVGVAPPMPGPYDSGPFQATPQPVEADTTDQTRQPSAAMVAAIEREPKIDFAQTLEVKESTPVPTIASRAQRVSTAPSSLPPPKVVETAISGPRPACPQCESPMAWVEEHLRFYCKQCRMYF